MNASNSLTISITLHALMGGWRRIAYRRAIAKVMEAGSYFYSGSPIGRSGVRGITNHECAASVEPATSRARIRFRHGGYCPSVHHRQFECR